MKLSLEESGASSGLQNLEWVGDEFQNFCRRADLKVICKLQFQEEKKLLVLKEIWTDLLTCQPCQTSFFTCQL
jgi:hypothetical protein